MAIEATNSVPDGSEANVARWVALAGVALLLAYAAGLLLHPGDLYVRLQSDLVYPLAPAFALGVTALRWRRSRGVNRRGWLAVMLGVAAWMVGDLAYTYYDLVHQSDPPFPGAADVLFGLGYLAFGVGVVALTSSTNRVRDWRWPLDAGLILVVVGATSWVYVLQPVANSGYSRFDAIVALSYPVGDVALVSLAIIGWYASSGRITPTRATTVAALVTFAAADAGYTYLVTTVGFDNIGNPLDPVWMAGYLLLAVAALLPDESSRPVVSRQSIIGLVLPYAVAAGVCLLAVLGVQTGNTSKVLIAAAAAGILLVIVRQVLTLTENVRLYRALEARSDELAATNSALLTSEARLRTVVSNAPVVLFALDAAGTFTVSEGAALSTLGFGAGEIVGRSVRDVYADEPAIIANVEAALRGEVVDDCVEVAGVSFATHYRPLRDEDGAIVGLIGVATDVSERERFQQQLLHIASHDTLTGLFNRRRLDEELSRTIAEFSRHQVPSALLFIDLDQFKDVNDEYGHRAGDELLTQVAALLRLCVRETDIVTRLGGDEFAVILTHADGDAAAHIASNLVRRVSEYDFTVQGADLHVTASVGLAVVGVDGTTSQELLSRADIAMYRAKDEGRNRARRYDADADADALARSGWQRRIRDALAEDRLLLYTQPIVALPDRSVAMSEVLVRMALPNGEVVGPASFLGVAERSGSIVDIDCWVLSRAIRLMAESRKQGDDLRLAVNVSGRSLTDRDRLHDVIRDELAANAVPGDHLVIEITETTAMHDQEGAFDFARGIKELGCGVALDDFGVGMSSFAQLKRLPIDILKIDGSFIVNLVHDRVDQQLVTTMTAAAHALNKKVVAEFVGDEETLQILASLGVDYVQGYHLGAPSPSQPIKLAA